MAREDANAQIVLKAQVKRYGLEVRTYRQMRFDHESEGENTNTSKDIEIHGDLHENQELTSINQTCDINEMTSVGSHKPLGEVCA